MSNILITGGSGYIGNIVTNLVLEKGHKARVVDLLWFNKDIPLVHMTNPRYEFIRGDIYDKTLLNMILKDIDFIIHIAAVVGEPASKKFPELTQRVNYEASKRLIDRAAEFQVKGFLFFSTCSNYGVLDGEANENCPLKPLSLYAQTKVDIEKYLWDKKGLDWIILRLSTVYGSSPRMRFDLTVNDFTVNAYINKTLDVFLPYTYRPYIHVFDAANVAVSIMGRFNSVKNNVFNIGFDGENYQKIEIVEIIKKYIPDLKVNIKDGGMDLRDYQVDFSKLKNYLGLEKTYVVEDGIREIIGLLEQGIIDNPKEKRYYNTFPALSG